MSKTKKQRCGYGHEDKIADLEAQIRRLKHERELVKYAAVNVAPDDMRRWLKAQATFLTLASEAGPDGSGRRHFDGTSRINTNRTPGLTRDERLAERVKNDFLNDVAAAVEEAERNKEARVMEQDRGEPVRPPRIRCRGTTADGQRCPQRRYGDLWRLCPICQTPWPQENQ